MARSFQQNLFILIAFAVTISMSAQLEAKIARGSVTAPRSPLVSLMPPGYFRLIWTSVTLFLVLFSKKDWASAFAIIYVIPLSTWYASNLGYYYGTPVLVFLVIPVLELVCGSDETNPTAQEAQELNNRRVFRWITWVWPPLQLVFINWACWAAANWQFTTWQWVGFVASIGLNTGVIGINISHELIHKNTWWEQSLGKVLLVSVCYGHWFCEHLFGHHRHVSTPNDPATSRLNQSFYAFWPQSVIGTWRSAWDIEAARMKKSGYALWSLQNSVISLSLISCGLAAASYYAYGLAGLQMFLGQSLVAFSMLEIVNYIEHYGLERKMIKGMNNQDAFEPVSVLHSWNADTRITNLFLFKLQRHSDHHAFASRRYQILRSFAESPQMPTGYGGMLVMALIPPLWYRIMNPLCLEFRNKLAKSREAAADAPSAANATAADEPGDK